MGTVGSRDHERADALARHAAEAEGRYQDLFTAVPHGLIHYAADGSIIDANPSACEILGLDRAALSSWPVVPPGQAVHEDGTPFTLTDLPMRAALRTGTGVAAAVMGIPFGRTGEMRWLRVTTVPTAPDEHGRPREGFVIFTDLTEQRRLDAALRESTGLLQHLRESNVLGVVAHTEQGTYDANDAFLELIGASRADLEAGRISYRQITPPEWAARDQEAIRQLRREGACQPYDKEYFHRDGHRVPVLVGGAVVEQEPLRWVTFVVDLTARQRAERERTELRDREESARSRAAYASERLGFLLRAGAMVAATRDGRQMLEHAAQLVVPALADHCVVFLPTADGSLRATSLAHHDPARAPVLAEFRQYKIPASGPMSLQVAYATGKTQVLRDAEAKLSRWHDLAPGLIGLLARLRADTVLSVPLWASGRPAGVLALARDAQRPEFAATDIDVVEEFARRLSGGLSAADAFAREHTIAETLQRSLLPWAFPDVSGVDVEACYLPASNGVHVGGDWYDAFPLGNGTVGLVIGDVIGHNITSASIMGQVRSLLRAYALECPDPGEVLERTGSALTRLLPDALATAVYAVLDPVTGELAYANAGHPPPLATRRPGDFAYLDDEHGAMLGASPGLLQQTSRLRLPAGGSLLFYTDGLIEDRERDITEGLSLLADTLRHCEARSARQICAAAESVLCDAQTRADDVCLLALHLPGPAAARA